MPDSVARRIIESRRSWASRRLSAARCSSASKPAMFTRLYAKCSLRRWSGRGRGAGSRAARPGTRARLSRDWRLEQGGPMSTGIRKLHSKGCAGRDGGRCNCGAGWEASVFSSATGRQAIRKTFPTMAAAKAWRRDAQRRSSPGRAAGTEADHARARPRRRGSRAPRRDDPQPLGRPLQAVRDPRLRAGAAAPRAARVRRRAAGRSRPVDVQDFVDRLLADGLGASDDRRRPCIRCGRSTGGRSLAARSRSTRRDGLELPARRGRRDRIARPTEAAALIAAAAGGRPAAVGDGAVRRPAARRAAGAALVATSTSPPG